MVKLSFLCHEPFRDSQAEPLIRCIPFLSEFGYQMDVVVSAGNAGKPEPIWPDIAESLESVRRASLDSATKQVLDGRPDLVLCHHRNLTALLLASNVPLVILENTDAPALEISRYLIHLDQVVGVIKGTVFACKDFYNGPFCEGMFHGKDINVIGLPVCRPERSVSDDDLSKVELGWSFGSEPNNKRLLGKDIDVIREIPISFVGTTHYPRSRLITLHRKLAMQSVAEIPGGVAKEGVSQKEFDDILFSSLLCLSPLGYGSCGRSFQGIYAGCVVVQPDCSYMKSWPNIYSSQVTYSCNVDFSDLDFILKDVRANWEYWDEMRHVNKERLVRSYWDDSVLGGHIKEILERCLKRIK